jgi:hypothetical protein
MLMLFTRKFISFYGRRTTMKALRMILILAVLVLVVAVTSGCTEEMRGQVDIHEINYALYGPHETDISME